VLPPAVAPVQVVLLPILNKKTSPEAAAAIQSTLQRLLSELEKAGVRCQLDDSRPHLRIGAKYFEWERRGVPLRVALGERDLRLSVSGEGPGGVELSVFDRVAYREDKWSLSLSSEKGTGVAAGSGVAEFVSRVQTQLSEMQRELLSRAEQRLASRVRTVENYEEMKTALALGEGQGEGQLFLAPWRESAENEQRIQEDCRATLRCYPADRNRGEVPGLRCFFSGESATHWALFGRAF
jgi:prolyl-tRNA synthetase